MHVRRDQIWPPSSANSIDYQMEALSHILVGVIRSLIIMLCAAALAFTPTAASRATAAPAAMPGCAMDGHMPKMPAERSKMDCCAVVCQMTAAALLPEHVAGQAPIKSGRAVHDRAPARELASFTESGLDPPPRLPS